MLSTIECFREKEVPNLEEVEIEWYGPSSPLENQNNNFILGIVSIINEGKLYGEPFRESS